MTDQQLALQAMSDAQHILEEFLQPRPHNDKRLLERLVEVLERPDVVVRSIACSVPIAVRNNPPGWVGRFFRIAISVSASAIAKGEPGIAKNHHHRTRLAYVTIRCRLLFLTDRRRRLTNLSADILASPPQTVQLRHRARAIA
jgi:hypothetical protein